jgi:adenylate kinase
MEQSMDVILFGPPGAGKGTQASAVCNTLNIPHVSTGDIFRRHLREGTELGLLAKSYMSRGELVPDETVVDIVASRLAEDDAMAGVLFDGFPRTVNQAELLDAWLRKNGRQVDVVVNLLVPDEVVHARLSGRRSCLACGATFHMIHMPPSTAGMCDSCDSEIVQRDDDRDETVWRRLKTYHAQTAPVLDWSRANSRVVDVEANQGIAAVRAAVIAAVSS